MPRLDESREALLHAGHDVGERVYRAWDGFCDFVLRDNVLEVAVGLMYLRAELFVSFVGVRTSADLPV